MTKDQRAQALVPKTKQQGAVEALLTLPGVSDIAKRFQDTELQVELKMPSEETLALLVDPEKMVDEAKAATVDSDEEYKLAKTSSDSLKDKADLIESGRTGGTKGILSLKGGWDALFVPARNAAKKAAEIYQNKMRAYEKKLEDEDKKTRAKQAEEAAAQRAELQRQAEEKRKRAEKLKVPAKKEEALREAESLEQAAAMIPTEFGQSETSVPELGSGGKQKRWTGEVTDSTDFLQWLWKEKLWHEKTVDYRQSGLNDLADAIKDTKEIPGFKAKQVSSYRRDSKRHDTGKD